ncbi:MAG: single-stranded-DNA-specific exonuclease RecJ [Candidatus Moranbacteria bacterium]|nr:single-stranded-DNA-specific exonuclease RecJ [Candidatus Moranbacteria bacterium]
MNKWILKPKPNKKIKNQLKNYSQFIQTLLFHRNITTSQKAEEFLSFQYEKNLHNPQKLSGMKKAVNRIKRGIDKKENIAIYGDYDADGVTATTILNQFFLQVGVKPLIYIPDRVKEGYGLNKQAGRYLKKKNIDLVITVDTGVRNLEEIKAFNKLNIDVVVTDHHAPPSKLPKAKAIINPHLDKRYPCQELSGAGVAFKLIQGLIKKLNSNKFDKNFEKWLLDLVAIGTIADLVPLYGENRILTKYGLIILKNTKRLGLKALMDCAQLNYKEKSITSEDVGYVIGPRINASGRMDHANDAFMLLNENNKTKARKMAQKLEAKNKNRQNSTRKIFEQVEKKDFSKEKIIIDGSKQWTLGLVGLVAGRLCDKYNKPTLIYVEEKNQIRGSARSIKEFNIINTLDRLSYLLLEYGGHKQAAGFTVSKKNFPKFKKAVLEIAQKEIDPKDLTAKIQIDYKVGIDEINRNLLEDIKALEPFGMGNPHPVFLIKNMEVKSIKCVGNGQKHLKITICKNKKNSVINYFQCIGFNLSDFSKKIKVADKIDIVFNLYLNNFNGTENLEFKIIDLRKSNDSK